MLQRFEYKPLSGLYGYGVRKSLRTRGDVGRATPGAQDHAVFGHGGQAVPAALTADERLTRNATRLPTMVSAASEYSARVVEPV